MSFSTSRGTTVKADLVSCSPCVAVVREDYHAAIADYHGTSLNFIAVMPKRWSGFRWNAATFRRVWASFAHAWLAEFLFPQLRIRSRANLGAVMSKLDLHLADTQLQQGLLASGEPFTLGALSHEASIRVDDRTMMTPLSDLGRRILGTH